MDTKNVNNSDSPPLRTKNDLRLSVWQDLPETFLVEYFSLIFGRFRHLPMNNSTSFISLKTSCSQPRTLHPATRWKYHKYICSCTKGFQSSCCHRALGYLFWQPAAYICLNLSPLSGVQQVNELSHFPALTSACRWDESESKSGSKNKLQQSDET